MTHHSEGSLSDLVARVRAGDPGAAEQLWDAVRAELRRWAEGQLRGSLSVRLDKSDLVQNALIEAQTSFEQFRGDKSQQLRGWLREILRHQITSAVKRHVRSQRRSVTREVPLPGSSVLPHRVAPSVGGLSTPSHKAMRAEEFAILLEAITGLPEDQREAIRLRYLKGYSLEQLAQHFDRSQSAVVGLLQRGLRALRRTM